MGLLFFTSVLVLFVKISDRSAYFKAVAEVEFDKDLLKL